VGYKLTAGSEKDRYVYMAEDLVPAAGLHRGQHVRAGQVIAQATGSGKAPGIEIGWSDSSGRALGRLEGYVPHSHQFQTKAGKGFSSFISGLSGGPGGNVPPGLTPDQAYNLAGQYKAPPTFTELLGRVGNRIKADISLAALTPGNADDLKALRHYLVFLNARLKLSKSHRNNVEIAQWADEIKNTRDQIKSLKPDPAVFKLGDLSHIGKWNIAGLQPTLDQIALDQAKAALTDTYDASGNIVPASLQDDIAAASHAVQIWRDVFALAAGGPLDVPVYDPRGNVVGTKHEVLQAQGTRKQQTEAATNLKSAQDALKGFQDQTKVTPSQLSTDLADALKQQLGLAQRATAIAQAQTPVFEHFKPPAFASGGIVKVGEQGMELAHLPDGTRIHSAQETREILRPPEHKPQPTSVTLVLEPGAIVNDKLDESKVRVVVNDQVAEMVRKASASGPAVGQKMGAGRARL
jgi:hypothetical protein